MVFPILVWIRRGLPLALSQCYVVGPYCPLHKTWLTMPLVCTAVPLVMTTWCDPCT